MKNSFHSNNFICLINAILQALTLSNDLTQSPSTSQSRLIRKVHHIGCIRLIFCAHPIGSDSPITTNLQKTGRKGGGHYIRHSVREIRNYIIPIPPAPPAGAAGCGSLIVDTTDSVVSSVDATLVAFWRALLVTFAGSRIPFSTISTYSSL